MARKGITDDILDIDLGDDVDVLSSDVMSDAPEETPGEGSAGDAGAPEDVLVSALEGDSFIFEPGGSTDDVASDADDDTDEVASSSDDSDKSFGASPFFAESGGVVDDVDDAAGASGAERPSFVRSSGGDDVIKASGSSEIIRSHKGADDIDAGAGDDLVVSGHGDDVLDGGSGDDVLNGGKGNDTLVYTLSENIGGEDRYDGGKGSDTLELRLTVDEFNDLREELISLSDWMAEHSYVKASSGGKFKDSSSSGAEKHAVFETSFGLDVRYIENLKVVVEGHGEVDLDEPLGSPEPDPVPVPEPELSPELVTVDVAESVAADQPVSVTLAAGSTTTVSINVDVKDVPPIYDVFMVQDLSGSFYDDLPNVKTLLPTLMENLSAESDVAFGVGSFVDKPYETFGWSGYEELDIAGDYVYKTDQAMSTDFAEVQASMDALTTYSGFDYPESQLEALVQTALRGAEIGFRDGSQKYVVLSTDAAFHKEGDFDTTTDAHGNIIAVADNDYDTDLEMEDYPEMAKVGELLKAAGITPIFAVTSYVMPQYQDLVDSWGFGSVVEMQSDSSNIIEAITAGITDTAVDLTLDITGDDYGYVTAMTPEVYPDAGPGTYTFDLTLEIPEDVSGLGSDGLAVSIPGYGTIDLDIAIAGMDLTGDDGANTLIGYDGNNIIDGMGGDDVLTGGAGNDTFVFADGSGKDRITDFQAGDLLDLRRVTTMATVADVIAAASQVGADTVIDFGTGDSVTLEGIDAGSLTEESVLI